MGTQQRAMLHGGEKMDLRRTGVGKLDSSVRDLEGTRNTVNQAIHRGHQKFRTRRFQICRIQEGYLLDDREEFLDQI